ncbi:MAG: hypothetical protein HY556_01455 [Euryarchaeota archaeon]|nr:hypothetical protein [Euryarchaeota archaeon]
MATSVKMRRADKERLDRLQAEIVARSGKRLSQQELLALLVALGERDREALTGELRPPGGRELAALMALPVSTGKRTTEETIDRDLYGGPVEPSD